MDVNVNGDVNVSVGNQRVESAWRQMIYDNKLKVFQACVVAVNTRNALTTFIHSKHESWQRLLKPTEASFLFNWFSICSWRIV